ncbi:putative ribonuclease H-like domain-containing protein [Tanacetum coccineum]
MLAVNPNLGGVKRRRKKDNAKYSQLAVDVSIHIENSIAFPNTKPDTPTDGLYGVTSLTTTRQFSTAVWVKFHDVPLVAYTSDGLRLIATKIDTPMIDNLVMNDPNLEGNGYTKETIHTEYEWVPLRCSTGLISGHSLDDCPKATPKRVLNGIAKGKGQTFGADYEGFIKVKKRKPGALNVESSIIEEVATGNKATTSGTQEVGQSSTPLVERINVFEKQDMEGKLVLVDDDGKPVKKVKYPGNTGSEDEVEPRRLEVKARSTLMMGIHNEHQLKFNSIKDAKLLLEAIEKRFGGNEATKKTQRNLLKQQYENFTAPSSEMLDQTFDRLQKLVSQLELLGEKLSQEDVNQKLLRSLSPEWNTHAVVWRNKADLDIMSIDDLYNNLKVYEPKVKGISSSSSSTLNMAFVSSLNNNTNSTNEAVDTAHGVTTASTQLIVNGNETIGFDKSKVECYNCHKRGHFARECRAPRNQDNKKESSRKSVLVKTSTSTALVSCDGLGGYDWSDQEEEGPNYALMAYSSLSSDLEVSNDSNCLKSCMETVELLKSQNDQTIKRF